MKIQDFNPFDRCVSTFYVIPRRVLNICRRQIYHSPKGRISLKRGSVFSASFRSRGALFRAATSESRRFSAEKRRLMFALTATQTIKAKAHGESPKGSSLVRTSSAKILRNFCEIRSLLLEVARRSFGMTLKSTPFPLSLKNFGMTLKLRYSVFNRKLFALRQKATLTFCEAKYFTFALGQIFHTAKPYFTRRSRISLKTRSVFFAERSSLVDHQKSPSSVEDGDFW